MADSVSSSSDHQKLIDRLSNLPEHIILHILSFLPTKMAVATSVLSKPWQHLWTLVPAIDLDNDEDAKGKFEDIVSKVLNSNKSPIIRRFCLSGQHCATSSLGNWLSSATERNVEELDLSFPSQSNSNSSNLASWRVPKSNRSNIAYWRVPESFKTLVVMKLMMEDLQFSINIGENLECCFPVLKGLHLRKVWFQGPHPSLSGIFASQFPLLEELVGERTTFHHDINISLPMLRHFEFDCECLESYLRKLRLNIEVPSLRCLVVRGFGRGSGGFRVENLHNLLDASLSSRFPLLQELVVNSAIFPPDINISLPKLRRLGIYSACSGSLQKYTLNIEAPSLRYLVLSNFERGGFRVEHLHSSVEANVDIVCNTLYKKYYDEYYGESLINFMNALSNVKRLNLSAHTMQEVRNASSHTLFHAGRIQPFHSLVKLDLQLDGSVLGLMIIMLSKFESLEHLKITESTPDCKGTKTEYSLERPTHVPSCLTYHLKTFCFEEFKCSEYEMELTIYILKNSLVLKNTKIVFGRGLIWKKGDHIETILSTTCRGSVECQLEFDQDVIGYDYDSDSY